MNAEDFFVYLGLTTVILFVVAVSAYLFDFLYWL